MYTRAITILVSPNPQSSRINCFDKRHCSRHQNTGGTSALFSWFDDRRVLLFRSLVYVIQGVHSVIRVEKLFYVRRVDVHQCTAGGWLASLFFFFFIHLQIYMYTTGPANVYVLSTTYTHTTAHLRFYITSVAIYNTGRINRFLSLLLCIHAIIRIILINGAIYFYVNLNYVLVGCRTGWCPPMCCKTPC